MFTNGRTGGQMDGLVKHVAVLFRNQTKERHIHKVKRTLNTYGH